jgi:peptidoglycan biosynthesis protein MviN/MurJ (putative lipid II flippase)
MLKIIAACTLMTLSLILIRWYVGDWRLLAGFWRIVWLLVAVGAGAAVYLLCHWFFGLRLQHLREV